MLSGAIEPIDLDIQAIIDEELSPAARSRVLAQAAREELARVKDINARALGATPVHTTTVDGVAGASEDRVRPDGTIVYEFDLQTGLFGWIAAELAAFAPVKSGRFLHSFLFFVDGVLAELSDAIPEGDEYVFMSSVAYAGKIEGENRAPESEQAPNGVFEAVAALAGQQFPGANISFGYRAPFHAAASGQADTPAITIRRG
jgi:hypothetical protein